MPKNKDDNNVDEDLSNKFDSKSMEKRAKVFKVDSALQNWKAKERKCTDSICCIMFSACMVFCTYFGIYGYNNGNIDIVLAPVDDQGRICGFDDGVTEYPNLFIWNLDEAFADPYNMFDYGTCVKQCPVSSEDHIECAQYDDATRVDNCANFIGRTPQDGAW
jgi:choline transporter-like protein 2/4/5